MQKLLKLVFILACSVFNIAYAVENNKELPAYTEDKPVIMVSADAPQFVIKLKSNATTGYAWFLLDYNSKMISPVSHTYQVAKDKNLVGAPGYELWTFRVMPTGFIVPQETMLGFVYIRPWEVGGDVKPLVFKVRAK